MLQALVAWRGKDRFFRHYIYINAFKTFKYFL